MTAARSPKVLVVDDDPAVRYTLRSILEEDDLDVLEAADGLEALEQIAAGGIELVLTDLRMPRMDGMTLIERLGDRPCAPRVIMITAHGSERMAVEAMKRGAVDYFAKPFEPDEIARVVRRNLETVRLCEENRSLRAELALRRVMIFESGAMRQVADRVERVAPRDITVLITGESGTGKELVARAIVKASTRAAGPYVRFNCAALPHELAEAELFGHKRGAFTGAAWSRTGLFRQAHGGTLLLDEITELAPPTQSKLLRVLQEREVRPLGEDRPVAVDVRILAATNRDVGQAVRSGAFRADLYYRLNVVEIRVPPLRDRPEDVLPLAEHFAERFAHRYGLGAVTLSGELRQRLQRHGWPGNVRELENAMARLTALADGPQLDGDPWPPDGSDAGATGSEIGEPLGLKDRVAQFERRLVAAELERCQGNQSEAARRLGVSRPTLIDKLKKHGLR